MRSWIKSVCILFFTCGSLQSLAQKGTLIEFGWDYPDASQLSTNLTSMQHTPFDGICFSLQRQIMEAFDTALKQPAYFEQDKLKSLKWGKYNSNFIILRGFGKTGGRWFDDDSWKTISDNMTNLSKALSNPGIKGILFDPEYYYADQFYNPWTYNKTQYPGQSFAGLQAQAKKRGTQFIKALQKYKKDLSFLSIWITSLIVEDRKYGPLEGTRHALLLPFIEGVLLGKKSTVKVIDGNEYAYWYNSPSQFLDAGAFLKKNLAGLMQSDRAKAEAVKVGIAQPIFYDGLLGLDTRFEKGYSNQAKWKWLEENLKFAMAATDDVTWFYNERLNWWQGPVNDTLYQILAQNKNAQIASVPLKTNLNIIGKFVARAGNINLRQGYYYLKDPKKPMDTGEPAFTYQLNRNSKNLSFNFSNKLPVTLSIFINNILFKTLTPTTNNPVVVLDKFRNGKVVILAKYADKTEASSIDIYK